MSYIPAVRNPLRQLPIRQYLGPFRNPLPGLGDVFGPAPDVMSDLPLTGPYTNPSSSNPLPSSALTGAQLGIAAAASNPNLPAPSTSQTVTNWLNTNSSTLAWVAGIGLAVLFLGRMGR